jgi:hypothetical protein
MEFALVNQHFPTENIFPIKTLMAIARKLPLGGVAAGE